MLVAVRVCAAVVCDLPECVNAWKASVCVGTQGEGKGSVYVRVLLSHGQRGGLHVTGWWGMEQR